MSSTMSRHWIESQGAREARYAIEERRPTEWSDEGKAFYGHECPTCHEERPESPHRHTGYLCRCEREEAARLKADYAERVHPDVALAIRERWGVARRYAGCTFDTFTARAGTEEALVGAKAWAEAFTLDSQNGLLLAGPFGSGKTHLAVAALRVAIDASLVEGRYVSAGDLVGRVRGGSGIYWTPVDDAIREELLVLDDLGQEVGTEFTRDVVARVIFGRYEAARPTIITSNHGPKGLTDIFGGAVVSRLHEMCDSLVLKASDYRTAAR